MRPHPFGIGLFFLLTATIFGGTTSSADPLEPTPVLANREAQRDLKAARRLYDDRRYYEAIPKLLNLISRSRGTNAGTESHYVLGLCYSEIEGYKDAIVMFQKYLELAPKGKFAEDSLKQVKTLSIAYNAKFPSDASIKAEIKRLEDELINSPEPPNSTDLKIQLADQYWVLGSYAQAGDLYVEIAKANPEFRSDQTFRERIDLHQDGTFTLITPDEQIRRAVEKEPLVIVNKNGFKTGRDTFKRTRQSYIVSGQIHNRSSERQHDVEVITTIYGFGNVIWDTKKNRIGRMNPGEIRAFSFKFQNFRNIEDLNRYTCEVTYKRK